MIAFRRYTYIGSMAILAAACSPGLPSHTAPSGEVLHLEIRSARAPGADEAEVTACFQLPSEADWLLGRLLGDVRLSDGRSSTISDRIELAQLDTDQSPPVRCDRLYFTRPGGFPAGQYTLTIERLAASIPQSPDWAALQSALDESGTGIIVAPLPDGEGPSFDLVHRPPEISDQEASLIVTGFFEPVVIGPWEILVAIEE